LPNRRVHPVPVERASTSLDFWLRYSEAAARVALEVAPNVDLIHCHEWMTIGAGLHLRATMGVPLIYNVHLPQSLPPTVHLENLGVSVADLTLVNSEAARHELESRELPGTRIGVVPNGIDLTEFSPDPDWPDHEGYLLFVGRLVPQKGVDVMLRAFAVVLRRCPWAQLVVVGDGDLQLYLKRVAYHLGIPHRVTFRDWQTGPGLVALYQRAAGLVVPSYYEPFGIVALEAMACGRPVIASRVGGLAEIIEDGVQGYLVEAGDYLGLARRMVGILRDADLGRDMGRAARDRAAGYAWDVVAEKTRALYAETAAISADLRPQDATSDGYDELQRKLQESLGPDTRSRTEWLWASRPVQPGEPAPLEET